MLPVEVLSRPKFYIFLVPERAFKSDFCRFYAVNSANPTN